MNDDTICLLKECNAGCKMATNSMEQVEKFIKNDKLKLLIKEYNDKHIKIGDECHEMLNEYNQDEKDPQSMAKAMSWISTEVKLMINDDTHQIATLMIDGSNMGIKSLSEYINKYTEACKKSVNLVKKLIKMEEDFMNDLKAFL